MFNLYPGKGKFNLQEYNTKYYASRHLCPVQVGKAYILYSNKTKQKRKGENIQKNKEIFSYTLNTCPNETKYVIPLSRQSKNYCRHQKDV